MAKTEDYIQIMIESLTKKKELLEKLVRKNEEQKLCVEGKQYDEVDWDAFNLLIAEKEAAINRINSIDDGFQSLYDRVKEQLNEDKGKYSNQIRTMQGLIKELTDIGISIQTGEERNRKMIESIMMGQKQKIKSTRSSLKAANAYSQSMHGIISEDFSVVNRSK